MKIWMINIGETTPVHTGRVLRMASLADELSSSEKNEIVWWSTTFDHASKKYLYDKTTSIEFKKNYQFIFLHSNIEYKKNKSIARFVNHFLVAQEFKRQTKHYETPDIIFCSYPTIDLSYQATKFAKSKKIPIIIDVRDLWPDIFLSAKLNKIASIKSILLFLLRIRPQYIFNTCSHIIGISLGYLQWAKELAKTEKKTSIIGLGYHTKDAEYSSSFNAENYYQKLGIPKKSKIIWFVGSFGLTYDLETVIAAAKLIQGRNRDIIFILTGDGELMNTLKTSANGLENIIFTGWVANDDKLKALAKKASIGLMPYISNAPQGLPNKLFEYMANSLPIISSLEGECQELIEKNRIGITYQSGNPQSLESKILEVIYDDLYLSELATNSFGLFQKEYDSKYINEKLLNTINSTINEDVS